MKIEIDRQLSVAIENQPGRLGQIGRLLAQHGIEITAFSVIDTVDQAMVRLVTEKPSEARLVLENAGLPVVEVDVLEIEVSEGPGTLAVVGETLAAANINIEYAYSSTSSVGSVGNRNRLIVKTANARVAKSVLDLAGDSNA
jgi:hypothetical protein